jgi:hypothetical protein
MALHIVPDAPKPAETEADKVRTRVKRLPKPKAMLQCPTCGGRELIESKIGMESSGKTASGGTKSLLCVACLLTGKRTVVL